MGCSFSPSSSAFLSSISCVCVRPKTPIVMKIKARVRPIMIVVWFCFLGFGIFCWLVFCFVFE